MYKHSKPMDGDTNKSANKLLNNGNSGGFSTISSKAEFTARFPDANFTQRTFTTNYMVEATSTFTKQQAQEVYSIIMPELLSTYSVLHREGEKTMYFPVFAVISKLLLVLRDYAKPPQINASEEVLTSSTETSGSEVDDDLAAYETVKFPPVQLRHEQHRKLNNTSSPVEFVVQNLDRIGLILEVKKLIGSLEWHNNTDFWQLIGELYAACELNHARCMSSKQQDDRFVYGALTSFTVWVFVRARIDISGSFQVQVSNKLTAFTEQQFTLDPESGAIRLLEFLVDCLRHGFDNATELLPNNLAGQLLLAQQAVRTDIDDKFLQNDVFKQIYSLNKCD